VEGVKGLNTKSFLFASITVIIWASSFPAIRMVLHEGYSPGHLVLTRYFIASIIFTIYAMWPGVKFRLPEKKDLLPIAVLGWTGISLYHIGVTFGEETVSAGTAGMIVGAAPIFTSLIAVFFLKEKISLFGWLGLALGFAGIAIITIADSAGPVFQMNKGVFFILMAACATAVMFAYQKPLLKRYSSIELTAYFTWVGTIPFFFFSPGLIEGFQQATLEAHLATIYIGIFPTVIGYVTWGIALSSGKASSVTSMLYIEPVFVIVLAWIWLNEWPSMVSLIGGAIAISGVLVIHMLGSKQFRRRKQNRPHTGTIKC
jgi:drug/metabolite transporter (DMT)-like permease